MSVQPNLPSGKGAVYSGQIGETAKFAKPDAAVTPGVSGMGGTHNDISDKSGFQADTSSYIVKKGTAYGEAAKLNVMPPGMDLSEQPMADIRSMPMRTYTGGDSYPGDGWTS